MAVIIHFTTLATFFWTNIMAWDIYKTFGQRTVLSHIRQKGWIKDFTIISWIPLYFLGLYFPRYAAYGFGVPTIIVVFALSIDTSGFIPSLTVGYGQVKKSSYPWNFLKFSRALAGCPTALQALSSTSSRCCLSLAPTSSCTSWPWRASITSPPSQTQVISYHYIG